LTDLVSHNLEGAVVTPSVVPRVVDDPVVLSTFVAEANDLDGVTPEGLAGLVRVDTTLLGQEVLIDSEGTSDRSLGNDVLLDIFHAVETVAFGTSLVLVGFVLLGLASLAFFGALWLHLGDRAAVLKCGAGHVVGACGHSLGLASAFVSEHTACYHSCFVEEVPGSANLATIAAL